MEILDLLLVASNFKIYYVLANQRNRLFFKFVAAVGCYHGSLVGKVEFFLASNCLPCLLYKVGNTIYGDVFLLGVTQEQAVCRLQFKSLF